METQTSPVHGQGDVSANREQPATAASPDKPSPFPTAPGSEPATDGEWHHFSAPSTDWRPVPQPTEGSENNDEQQRVIAYAPPNEVGPAGLIPDTGQRRFRAHHLGRHHCDGVLVFTKDDFRFNCLSDGFTVERDMVEKVDNNGVRLLSGKKYHFNVSGYNTAGVHDLFSEWLE